VAAIRYADTHPPAALTKPKFKEILAIGQTYMDSFTSIDVILKFPGNSGLIAVDWEKAQAQAVMDLCGPDPMEFPEDKLPEVMPKIIEKAEEYFAKASPDSPLHENHRAQTGLFEEIVNRAHQTPQLEQFLRATLLQAWTAFEHMAGVLWEFALNKHPVHLAELSGKPKDPFKGLLEGGKTKQPPNAPKEQERKWMRMDDLKKHTYDVSSHMGEILKHRFQWTSLPGIREAYVEAFKVDSDAVIDAIMHISLDALSAIRNVIAHKNGIIDCEFLTKFGRCKLIPELGEVARLGKDDKIFITGDILAWLLENTNNQGLNLMKAVDDWLQNHA